MTHRGNRAAGTAGGGSGAVLESPALVAGLDDLAVVGQAVEQRGGHLGVAEDGWPFAEGEVGGDDDRGALVEPAHEVEEQLPAGLSEGQVAEFVEDDEVASDELVCGAALAPGTEFGLEVVDQVDDVVAAAACALSDAGPRDGDGEMGLAGAGAADEHDVALALQEAAAGELLDRGSLTGEAAKSKSASSLAVGSLADAIWYLIERACLSAISTCSSVPMICCTGWRRLSPSARISS